MNGYYREKFILFYVQHLRLTFNFASQSMVTKYQVIQGFNTNIWAYFRIEMFLSWAIDQNGIKHDLLYTWSKQLCCK